MASGFNPGIPKLKGREDYEAWKFAVQALLEVEGLWDIVIDEEKEKDAAALVLLDRKAKSRLILLVDAVNYAHINGEKTAKGVWDQLKNAFDDTGLSRRVGLLRTLITTRLDDCENMEDFVNRIILNAHKLRGAGMVINDEWVGTLLLAGLGSKFEPMIMAIENSGIPISADQIKVKLLQDSKKGINNGESSMYTRNFKPNMPQNNKTKEFGSKNGNNHHQKPKIKCFKCGRDGHFARECRMHRTNEGRKEQQREKNGNESNWSCVTGKYDESIWYIDSGASAHMTCRRELFDELHESNSATVTVANNSTLEVKGEGSVKLSIKDMNVTVHNVLYVPGICANLLSVSAMLKKNMRLEFHVNGCDIKNSNGVILATATNTNGMFRLNSEMNTGFLAARSCSNDAILWHKRLAHASFKKLQQINASWTMESSTCDICLLGKHTRQPFKESTTKSQGVLELIHTDVCGPMQVKSLQSSLYFVTFIDDYSRKVVVYCIENKSMVFDIFKEFKARVENQTGKKIITLRSDNGKEYCNQSMDEFLRKNGIVHQTTVPYTPEQNGVAERMNRTLVEKARCMLFEANLGTKFWAEAITTAAYVANRIPFKSSKKSPEEIWTNNKQDISNLRIFGCRAMAHIPKEKRSKFDAKSKSCIFVGYCSTSKGYRLYDPSRQKVIVSRDVKFFEEPKGVEKGEKDVSDFNNFYFHGELRNEVKNKENRTIDKPPENVEEDDETDEFEDANCEEESCAEKPDELRRSQRIRQPVDRYVSHAVEVAKKIARDPESISEAFSGINAEQWKKAMENEHRSLIENETWELVQLPPGRKAIANKWVFKRKLDENGNIDRYKARLVVKGCSQKEGIDYFETFSPVVRYSSIRFLIAIAAKYDLDIDQMDAVTAFLQGELKEEVYMRQPTGLEDGTERVCRLKKSLYGLKQASRVWNEKLGTALIKAGLKCSQVDTCIYYKINGDDILIVAIYVDDLLIFSNKAESKLWIKKQLLASFKMIDNGAAKFILGMHIERNRAAGTISIDQHKYIREVLERFNMSDCNPVSTPADCNAKLTKDMAPTTASEKEEMSGVPYQEVVGSLLYAALVTRPDIQFAVNTVSRFNNNPGKAHWNACKRILRYLNGTINYKLTYCREKSGDLHGYCDADWAGDESDRRSMTGYVFIMQGGAVTWNSKKQPTVALSTTEAEYMAMSTASQEAIWLRNLGAELFGDKCKTQINIFGDNKSALQLSEKTTTFHPRTKHIDIRHHFVRDNVNNGIVKFTYTATDDMTADILTKALPQPKLIKCRIGMNII